MSLNKSRRRIMIKSCYKEKNGIEDLKKARKNLDWLIEEMEHE